jgi:hypothetical protein
MRVREPGGKNDPDDAACFTFHAMVGSFGMFVSKVRKRQLDFTKGGSTLE